MKRFFEKNELGFSLMWVGIYIVSFSIFDGVSGDLGIDKLITAPAGTLMAAGLLLWIWKSGLLRHCGLVRGSFCAKTYLWFLPLVLLVSVNFWGGISSKPVTLETWLFVVSMIAVGFLEEVIFRGFLFRYLYRENRKWAVAISSITFGVGHILNLLAGAEVLPTVLQILYATSAGFLFTVIFMYSASLLPCIIAHCALNALSVFGAQRSEGLELVSAAVLTVVALVYGLWICYCERRNDDEGNHCLL